MFKIIKVQGDSMYPCYRHNDYVVLAKYWPRHLKAGDDIVCKHKQFGTIIKRIHQILDKKIQLTGLNTSSTSQQDLGHITYKDVIGRVIWHVAS